LEQAVGIATIEGPEPENEVRLSLKVFGLMESRDQRSSFVQRRALAAQWQGGADDVWGSGGLRGDRQ
jgi:hypothetical protein